MSHIVDIFAYSTGAFIAVAFVLAFVFCPVERFGTNDETNNEDMFSDFID